jgi:protein-tyrosine-phosphatase
MKPLVRFVCVANRLRSVFAEFYFRDTLEKRGEDVTVSSAGFVPQALREKLAAAHIAFPDPFFNRPMSDLTRKALLEKGILVPEGWRSVELRPEMVQGSDLIVTALGLQKEELSGLYNGARSKIFSIRELSGKEGYLYFEDSSAFPLNQNYWYHVEEDPAYVSRQLREWEETLVGAIPNIIRRLGLRGRV